MNDTINSVLREETLNYLHTLDMKNLPTPQEIESQLLSSIETAFTAMNTARPKGSKWKLPQKLEFSVIAEIMAYIYPICRINTAGAGSDTSYDLLAIYQSDGPNEGIYVTDDETFRSIAEQYNYTMTSREFQECMTRLRGLVPRVSRTHEPNLIAVQNGIFDYDTKQLLPFSPKYVFLTKSRVAYNPNAVNPVIHNNEDGTDWDVETWMSELSDDPEIVNVLWEILGAIIRPNVAWNKSAWFYSETGNNGKGTLCELMRELCGDGAYASIPLSDMGKDFLLEPLTRASAVIVDENDVGTYIDKAANLKAIITNDVIQINRKFKTPIPYKFYGFMVQCLNEMPRIRDRSDSFFRRQLFIPFTKCFTGAERKYIKRDYLHRRDVLEYVLFRVLNMNYYQLSTPATCVDALNEYKEFNDPVRQFAEDVMCECVWDILPFNFLYDLYKSWFKRMMPSGSMQNSSSFINDIVNIMKGDDVWVCDDKRRQIRTTKFKFPCEPLIDKYELHDWENPKYKGTASTIEQRCTPALGQISDRVRGFQRIHPTLMDDDN